ncbi:hypothetical protein BG000_002669 [Podila horticola]|nr:hypothetical protein BG000_002669 [Podila horticola]
MASPWNRVVLLCLLITLFSSFLHINPGRGTLVTAQKLPFFKQKQPPAASDQAARREQQAVKVLRALSSSSSSTPTSDQQDSTLDSEKKTKRLSKGKGIQDLLAAVEASHVSSFPASSSSEASGEEPKEQESNKIPEAKSSKANKKPKMASGHGGDIIHEQDHADNDAYDDIVWYDGPHRDDEDEHGDYGHDDHHDDHDDEDEEEDEEEKKRKQASKMTPEVLANLQKLSGTPNSGLEEQGQGQGQGQGQLVFQNDHDHHTEDDSSHEGAKVFQHSGADVIVSGISPKEFCLRLKHECESTCRQFTAEVEHLSTSCDAGSVAELLFWGRCCQIGQEHRRATGDGVRKSQKKKTTIHLNKSKNLEYTEAEENAEARQERLIEEHLRSQLKRHMAKQEMNQQKPQ